MCVTSIDLNIREKLRKCTEDHILLSLLKIYNYVLIYTWYQVHIQFLYFESRQLYRRLLHVTEPDNLDVSTKNIYIPLSDPAHVCVSDNSISIPFRRCLGTMWTQKE